MGSVERIRCRPAREEQPGGLRRVALVTGNYVDVRDGASLTLHRVVEALEARGVEVAVVAPATDGATALPAARHTIGVPAVTLPMQNDYRLPMGLDRRARRALERFAPQLVHVATPDPAGWAAVGWARRRGLPLASTFHTNFASYLGTWGPLRILEPLAWALMRRFYEPFDRVFVPTESMGQELVHRRVLERYDLFARGVDRAVFHPRHRSPDWRRQVLGVDDRTPVVLFCARLVWEKGLRTLADALARLREHGPEHRVLIVGDGEQEDWLREQLPWAHFAGFLTGEALSRVYASSDLFLYPSATDTFGNVTLEAMASGLPVVGADAPGTRSLVEPGRSGLLIPPRDADALARQAAALLHPQGALRRERLRAGALARARSFDWDAILSGLCDDLESMVAAPASAGLGRPAPTDRPIAARAGR